MALEDKFGMRKRFEEQLPQTTDPQWRQ